MSTRIQKLGLANGIKPTGKNFTLSDLIQESYKLSYEAKRLNNKKLINLTESHLANIKKNPMDKSLSEDLDVLDGLIKLGKDQKLKDIEEVDTSKKRRKKSINGSMKPATQVKESSWIKSKDSMTKALSSFRESAKSKVFYKELGKFNKSISDKAPITMTEAVKLYKASNSCLTHLTVELEKNPSFRNSYKECTKLLSSDNLKLLESIQNGKVPSRSLLENFAVFTNILLECDAPEKLDPTIYEDADIETLDDRDVINEDADMEELDDRDVIDEDADIETLDDRDVINEEEDVCDDDEDSEDIDEDADMEELDDRDVINEDVNDEDSEDVNSMEDDSVSVDLTPEEITILKSILGKISSMQEEESPELVPDEEEVPEINEDDDTTDEDIPDEDPDVVDSTTDDEDLEEDDSDEDPVSTLEDVKDKITDVIDQMSSDDLTEDEEDEEDIDDPVDDMELNLSESAINRIKKCF